MTEWKSLPSHTKHLIPGWDTYTKIALDMVKKNNLSRNSRYKLETDAHGIVFTTFTK
jgi:hypothetical protein